MCQGLNSHYFHIIGDGHQPNSVGVYIPIIRIPIQGEMTIPNIAHIWVPLESQETLDGFKCLIRWVFSNNIRFPGVANARMR